MMNLSPSYSFRDPDGKVIDTGERVFRVLADSGWSLYQELVASGVLSRLGTRVVKTWVCEDAGTALPRIPATQGLEGHPVLEHERIPFPSYPCEWSPRMLFDVGEFLLDLLSFERLPPDLRVWLPQAQFERNFLYPLMIYSFLGLPPGDFFLKCRDGVELEQAAGLLCRGFWVLRPTVFTNLFMPVLLGKFFRDPTKGLSSTVQHSSPSPQDESAREKNLFTLNTLQTILGWK